MTLFFRSMLEGAQDFQGTAFWRFNKCASQKYIVEFYKISLHFYRLWSKHNLYYHITSASFLCHWISSEGGKSKLIPHNPALLRLTQQHRKGSQCCSSHTTREQKYPGRIVLSICAKIRKFSLQNYLPEKPQINPT